MLALPNLPQPSTCSCHLRLFRCKAFGGHSSPFRVLIPHISSLGYGLLRNASRCLTVPSFLLSNLLLLYFCKGSLVWKAIYISFLPRLELYIQGMRHRVGRLYSTSSSDPNLVLSHPPTSCYSSTLTSSSPQGSLSSILPYQARKLSFSLADS